MSTHPDLQPIGRAYGLDVEEVHRALRWASIAKQAARGGTSKGSALGFAAAPSPPKVSDWCQQCDQRVSKQKAAACTSRFCKAKGMLE